MHSTDNRVGVPNVFVRRSSLDASTLEEARDRGLLAARARGTNQFFADTGGRLWDLETSATAFDLADHTAAGFMAHTNHYASPAMQAYEGYGGGESRGAARDGRALLAEGLAAATTPWTSSPACCARTTRLPTTASAATRIRAAAGRPGHDGRQHHLRPGRAAACTPAPGRRARTSTRCSRWVTLERPRPGRRQRARRRRLRQPLVPRRRGHPRRPHRGRRPPGTLRGRRVVDAAGRYVGARLHRSAHALGPDHPAAPARGDGRAAGRHHARHRQLRHVGGAADGEAARGRGAQLGALRLGAGEASPGTGARSASTWPRCRRGGHAINLAPLVGHGALRLAAVGFAERAATERELARMERLLDAQHARRRARPVQRAGVPAGLLREHGGAGPALPGGRRATRASTRRTCAASARRSSQAVAEALELGRAAGCPSRSRTTRPSGGRRRTRRRTSASSRRPAAAGSTPPPTTTCTRTWRRASRGRCRSRCSTSTTRR